MHRSRLQCEKNGCADRLLSGPQLLPIIAEYADAETMNILASSQPLKLACDVRADSITANREVLKRRQDYSESLSETFEELIAIAQIEEAESASIDSLMESGRFFSARSSFRSELAEAMAMLDSAAVSPVSPSFSELRFSTFQDFEEMPTHQ